jgi:hypothetical protein
MNYLKLFVWKLWEDITVVVPCVGLCSFDCEFC